MVLAQRRGLQAGKIAGYLLLLNPFLVHLAAYPWPKAMAAAFELAGLYWTLRARDGQRWAWSAAGASLALAVATHTSGLVFLVAIAAYALHRRHLTRQALGEAAAGGAAILPVLLPWALWGAHSYGWRGVLFSSPTTTDGPHSAAAWLIHTLGGFFYSLIPVPALEDLIGHGQSNVWFTVSDALAFPFSTFTGAVGVGYLLSLLTWRHRVRLADDTLWLGMLFASAAVVGSVALDPTSLAGGAAPDALAAAVGLGIALLAGVEPLREHARTLLVLVGTEFALVMATYAGYLSIGSWRMNPNSVVLAGMDQHLLSAGLGPAGVLLSLIGASMVILRCLQVRSA